MNIYLLSILAVIIVVLLSLFVILKMTEFIKNLLQKHKLEVQTIKSNHEKELDKLKSNHKKDIDAQRQQHFKQSQAAIENLELNFEHKIQMLNLEKPKILLGRKSEIMEMPVFIPQNTTLRPNISRNRPEAVFNQDIRYEKDKRILELFIDESFIGRVSREDIEHEIASRLSEFLLKNGFIDGHYKIERNTILFYFNYLH